MHSFSNAHTYSVYPQAHIYTHNPLTRTYILYIRICTLYYTFSWIFLHQLSVAASASINTSDFKRPRPVRLLWAKSCCLRLFHHARSAFWSSMHYKWLLRWNNIITVTNARYSPKNQFFLFHELFTLKYFCSPEFAFDISEQKTKIIVWIRWINKFIIF